LGIGIPFMLASLFSGPFMRLMARLRGHMGTPKGDRRRSCADRRVVFDWRHAAHRGLAGNISRFAVHSVDAAKEAYLPNNRVI
jgi:hypothetical protein